MKLKRRIFSILLTVAFVAGLILIPAVPAMAADGSGTCTVTPTEVTAGSTGNTLTFTFTAEEAMDTGEITITAPALWSEPQGTGGTAGYTTATSTGEIGTPTFADSTVTVPITTLANEGTITVVYGDGGGDSGATAQQTAETATFVTKSKPAAAGTLTELTAGSPTVTVNPDAATQLVFTTQPADSVSGIALTTQPVVEAQDQYDNKDTSYVADVVAATDDLGTLTGTTTKAAVAGVAEFTDLIYTATADTETFQIDVTSGALTPATSSDVVCDVLATQLVFTVQPTAGDNSGALLGTQPIVTAKDAGNLVDTDFTETVAITADVGTLSGDADVAAVSGVAEFTDLVHTASADNEVTTLTADDEAAAPDLPTVDADTFTTLVIATKLVFTTQPTAGANSGALLGTQPIVAAQDADDTVDTDFTETVTITADVGALSGDVDIAAVDGVATFTDLVHTASADNEVTTLTANDEAAVDTDLPAVNANTFTTLVIATKLVIVTQPDGAVSGVALVLQPVINAVDADGTRDADWVTACAVAKESGTGTVAGGPVSPMVAGVATFTDVKVTETPVTHDSYTLRFTSTGLTDVVSDAFKVFDKAIDLNDNAWTLISTDDYIISSGDDTSAFEGSVSLKYKYTGSSYTSATVADIEPVEALYVKTTSDDGLVGLNYSTAASPGASIKDLLAGWNLISSATSTDAGIVLSPLHYVQIGEQEGTGLATLVSQGSYNLTTIDWYIDATTWANVTGTMDPFDGYWVYMNAAKSFGVLPQ